MLCSQDVPTFGSLYNFDIHEPIFGIFGRNVNKKVSNQMALHLPPIPNNATSLQNDKPEIGSISSTYLFLLI